MAELQREEQPQSDLETQLAEGDITFEDYLVELTKQMVRSGEHTLPEIERYIERKRYEMDAKIAKLEA